jgi:16S rRNA (uracil1498-N3)-methyltransferase
MNLSFFFVADLNDKKIVLDEDNSKHIIGVLRKKKGDEILLTDGKGRKARSIIVDDNRKRATVEITSIEFEEQVSAKSCIAISLTKNTSRFEWFLEKATELGISEIIPLLCHRTEKEKFRFDRMQQILVSAMLQSQQCRMPVLHEPTEFMKAIQMEMDQKFIAHCIDEQKQTLAASIDATASRMILIGPEGDFTREEVNAALQSGFQPVSLGDTRLRTETAGMAAAVLLKLS